MSKFVRLLTVLFLLYAPATQAATLYIDPGRATLYRGDSITLAVRIMPDAAEGECINTVDATLSYSDNIQPVDVSIGKSIFSIWIERPVINKENHTITFAGGIPNGYCGRVEGDPRLTNVIAEIVFRSPGMQVGGSDDIEAKVDFTSGTRVLLNDGLGTEAPLRALGGIFTLEKTAGQGGIIDAWREDVREDDVPPEKFSIELQRDENGINFNGRYYIIFNTSDKQTGISHYEVMEEPVLEFANFSWGGVGVPWVKIGTDNSPENSYVLKDQSLNSIILVKAIDKAGNEYIATYIPSESHKTLSKNEFYDYGLVVLLVLVFIFLIFIAVRIVKKRRRFISEKIESESSGPTKEIEIIHDKD